MFGSLLKNLRFLFANLGHLLPAWRMQRPGDHRYPDFRSRRYDICIEGFQRSGNTFFVALFQHWNPRAAVAHHTHLASTSRQAVRSGVPSVILIRQPEAAIASLIAWDSRLWIGVALFSYLAYYRGLRPLRKQSLVLLFDDVASAPADCIERINHRFTTGFDTQPYTDAVEAAVTDTLRREDRQLGRGELNASLPTADKAQAKARIEPRIRSSYLFRSANRLYQEYCRAAGAGGREHA